MCKPAGSPSLAYSPAHFSLKGPQIFWTAIFGFVWLCEHLRPRDPLPVLEELQALRLEIARTRDLVYDLEASSGSCLWQLWGQGWLLRLAGLADLVLIFLLIPGWFQRHREPADSAELLEEPSIRALPSSTTSVLSADSRNHVRIPMFWFGHSMTKMSSTTRVWLKRTEREN